MGDRDETRMHYDRIREDLLSQVGDCPAMASFDRHRERIESAAPIPTYWGDCYDDEKPEVNLQEVDIEEHDGPRVTWVRILCDGTVRISQFVNGKRVGEAEVLAP